MSFTIPTHLNFLTKPVLEELMVSFSEIAAVVDGMYQHNWSIGDSLQDGFGFWWFLQQDTMSAIGRGTVIDHVNGPLNDTESDLLPFNETTFLEAAGLVGGFRRARGLYLTGVNKGKPIWVTKGFIKHGDLVGPWIVEDLQKVLSTIKWTMREGKDISNVLQNPQHNSWVETDWGTRDRAAWEAWHLPHYNAQRAWANYDWGPDVEGPYSAEVGFYGYGFYDCWGNATQGRVHRARTRAKSAIKDLPTTPTHTADLYNKLLDPAEDPSKFVDFDGIGLEPNKRIFIESFSSASEHEQSSWNGNSLTDPADIVGITPFMNEVIGPYNEGKHSDSCYPLPFSVYANQRVSMDVSEWLLKWNFTY